MIFKIAICDDEPSACDRLKTKLEDIEMLYNYEFQISVYIGAEGLLSAYSRPGLFDILFLDVEMPGLSGLSAARAIRRLPDPDVKIIFVSNYPEYMQDSFNVGAFQYLQKPIRAEQILEQVKRFALELEESSGLSILVKGDGTERPVFLNQILYIESVKNQKNFLRYVCKEQTLVGKGNLSDMDKSLSTHHFFSPHRGLLVNMRQVRLIRQNGIEMSNGDRLPLSRRREKEFRDYFNRELLQ